MNYKQAIKHLHKYGVLPTHTREFPIMAGMEFTYPDTKNNKLHQVGHYTKRFTYSADGLLLKEEQIERVFY